MQLADAAPYLCRRAVHLIEHDMVLALAVAGEARAAGGDPLVACASLDKSLTVAALDLLSGLAEAFGPAFDELVGAAGPTLPEMLFECLKLGAPSVRQSAFALLGEMAKTSMPRFAACLGPVIITCAASIKEPRHYANVCNNAVWALGQLLLAVGPPGAAAEARALSIAVTRLVGVMRAAKEAPVNVVENTAIALGRVGLVAPAALSSGLGECLGEWCAAAVRTHDVLERRHTYEGMCQAIAANAAAAVPHVGNVLVAFVVYEDATPACAAAMRAILLQLKALMGAPAWATLLGRVSAQLRDKITERFGRDILY